MNILNYFDEMETRWTGQVLRFLLLFSIMLVTFPIHIGQPSSGLDPSWQFALNYFVNSELVFGKDVIFTYGPLGFLVATQDIGNNVMIAFICNFAVWLIFISSIYIGLVNKIFSLNNLLLFSIAIVPLYIGMDHFTCFLVLVLLSFTQYIRYWVLPFLLAILLTVALFFMKFSAAPSAYAAILGLSFLQLWTNRNRGILQLSLSLVLVPSLFVVSYYLYNPSISDMAAYLGGMLEISSGYSVTMSRSGKTYEYYLAACVLAAYIYLSIQLLRSRQKSFATSVAFLPSLFVAYKHGFVRQDGFHVAVFFAISFSLFGLILLFTDLKKARIRGLLCTVLILVSISLFIHLQHPKLNFAYRILTINNFVRFVTHQKPKPFFWDKPLERSLLPEPILEEIGAQRIGIFPFEVSYVAANNLKYAPFPVFQSFAAYTSGLDKLNAEYLVGEKAPPMLLMNFASIDGRHCLIDVPATWLSIYNWYEPSQQTETVLLLKRRQYPRFDSFEPVSKAVYDQTETISIPETDGPMLAKISMNLTLKGKLLKTIYKILPVEMILTDEHGIEWSYRIVPDTVRNGIIINHVPLNLDELNLLMKDNSSIRTFHSVRFHGKGMKMYDKKISVDFVRIRDVHINKAKEASYDMFSADILKSSSAPLFHIDSLADSQLSKMKQLSSSPDENYFRIIGWAVDPDAGTAASGVWVKIDGKVYPTDYGSVRQDVAMQFHNEAFAPSAFSCRIPVSSLAQGSHSISVVILAGDKTYYYESKEFGFSVRHR